MTCAKTQGFLARHKVTVTTQADAKKATIKGDAALSVLKDVDELYVAKGKRIVHVDLRREKPPRAELLGLLLGPDGQSAGAHAPEEADADRRLRRSHVQGPARVGTVD